MATKEGKAHVQIRTLLTVQTDCLNFVQQVDMASTFIKPYGILEVMAAEDKFTPLNFNLTLSHRTSETSTSVSINWSRKKTHIASHEAGFSIPCLLTACTKTRNTGTKRNHRNHQNHRDCQNETIGMTRTSRTTRTNIKNKN